MTNSSITNYLLIIFISFFVIFYHSFYFRSVKPSNKCGDFTVSEYEYEFGYNYSTLLKKYGLNESNFYGLPYFGNQLNYDTHTFQGLADHIYPIKNVSEVKCGDIIFIHGDFVNEFFNSTHSKIQSPYILISHNSPHSAGLPNQLKYLDDPKIIAWFAKNAIGKHSKLKMLPLGLPPFNISTIKNMSKNLKPFNERNITLYLNFSPHTHPDRIVIQKYIQTLYGNDSDVIIVKNGIKWDEYLLQLNNAKFVVSPPGAGFDCYRTWEAIIMGAVPIILQSEITHLYDGLPVMFVDSWTDIKKGNLEIFEQKYLKSFDGSCPPWRPKIWARFWITEIMDLKISAKNKICKMSQK